MPDGMWNPVVDVRKKYPALKDWSDDRILKNMSDPVKFRAAFPEYAHLDDDKIKKNVAKLQSNTAPAKPDFSALPDNKEGLYKMVKDTGEEKDVPFSKVADAGKAGWKMPRAARETYAKDRFATLQPGPNAPNIGAAGNWAEGRFFKGGKLVKQPPLPEEVEEEPGTWSGWRDAFQKAAVPTGENRPTDYKVTHSLVDSAWNSVANWAWDKTKNQLGIAANTIFGAADMAPQIYAASRDLLSYDPHKSVDGFLRLTKMMPPVMAKQYADHIKELSKENPGYAADDVIGTAIGIWATGKITEGAVKVGEKTKRAILNSPETGRRVVQEMAGIRKKTATDLVQETGRRNAEAEEAATKKNTENAHNHLNDTQDALHKTRGAELEHEAALKASKDEAEERNAEAARQHLENTQEALHETTGKEIEYQARVKAETEKSQADHEEAIAKVKEHNDRVAAKHEKVANRIKEENTAADHALELRRQREAELQKETDSYYAKEDAVKSKAKAEENAAWQPWHDKMEGVEIDGGRISEPIKKIAAISPDVERTLNQLIPDPADATPESLYAQDRMAIMKSQGIDSNYWDLPAEKRVAIDRIAASSGFEPEPIDFDPQTGRGIPVEQIHRAKSILGRYIRSGRYEGPLLGEMKQVFKVLEQAETRASIDHGALGDLEAARGATRKYQEAFGRERHIPRTLDEIRKQQANPEQFKEENDQERIDAAGKHSQELVDAHEKVKALREELKKMQTEDQLRKAYKQVPPPPSIGDLREGYRLKTEPKPPIPAAVEPPTRTPSPDRPPVIEPKPVEPPARVAPPDRPPEAVPEIERVGEEELTDANRKQFAKTIETLRSRGIWYGAALPWLWVARDMMSMNFGKAALGAVGAAMESVVSVVGLTKLSDVLEKPEVREWVARPSPTQIRELYKLPSTQRGEISDAFRKIRIVAAKKGYKVSPLITKFMAANRAANQPRQTEEQE